MHQSSPHRRRICSALSAVALTLITAASLSSPARAEGCTDHILEAEKEYDIPRGLLLAMSLVESGQDGKPYPWALNVNGKSVYSDDRAGAEKALKDKKGRLHRNTMAGCMQLSVYHHKAAFRPVERILDPKENVFYAAKYLKRHRTELGNWTAAIRRYNGGSPQQTRDYICKIRQTLVKLDPESAKQLDTTACNRMKSAAIAPETRVALVGSQTVAEAQ